MKRLSAGLLMYRRGGAGLEVLLVHPGGPFWAKKDKGFWTIPKGGADKGEDLLTAARREFGEETGFLAAEPFLELGRIVQAGGKEVVAWAFAGDCDPRQLRSNECEVEWPPRSGRRLRVPEVDRGAWFSLAQAGEYVLASQRPFLDRLREVMG